jgi:tRNA (cytidine/uridine-2'-O-)-methyltransferase
MAGNGRGDEAMFDVVLYQPEIAPNTGNIMRLCANTGSRLHLIHPLGFQLQERRLLRAGLDYRDWVEVRQHQSLEHFIQAMQPPRLIALSTRGRHRYSDCRYLPADALVFGPETRGLPPAVLNALPDERVLRIPMRTAGRSLNLANAVAVVVYEAWRQQDFASATY